MYWCPQPAHTYLLLFTVSIRLHLFVLCGPHLIIIACYSHRSGPRTKAGKPTARKNRSEQRRHASNGCGHVRQQGSELHLQYVGARTLDQPSTAVNALLLSPTPPPPLHDNSVFCTIHHATGFSSVPEGMHRRPCPVINKRCICCGDLDHLRPRGSPHVLATTTVFTSPPLLFTFLPPSDTLQLTSPLALPSPETSSSPPSTQSLPRR